MCEFSPPPPPPPSLSLSLSVAVILRLAQTVYTWSERDGEVAVVIEKIGSNERVITTSLFINPITARGVTLIVCIKFSKFKFSVY